jgi:uncharacterized membrane protein
MKPLRIVAWVVTGIFAIYFIYKLIHALSIHTSYGSPGTSFPYVFGLLLGCSIVPGILWIITIILEKKKK